MIGLWFDRIRGVVFTAFGAYLILFAVFAAGVGLVHGFSSGVWHFESFGEYLSRGPKVPRLPQMVDTLLRAPLFVYSAVIGAGLLWQGARNLALARK